LGRELLGLVGGRWGGGWRFDRAGHCGRRWGG
jgi:hypothetical protein